jgi:hypothetical protein
MQLSFKQKLSLAGFAGWVLAWAFDPFITVFHLNIETWAQKQGYDKLYEYLPPLIAGLIMSLQSTIGDVWETVTGPVGLSFFIGAVLFAFWDPLAKYASTIRRRPKVNLRPHLALSFDGLFAELPVLPLTVMVKNEGGTCRVSAKVFSPQGAIYRDTGNIKTMDRQATWSDGHIGAREMFNGDAATMVLGLVDAKDRTVKMPFVEGASQLGSWDIENLPFQKEFEIPIRFQLVTDPPAKHGPIFKEVRYSLTLGQSGALQMTVDPAKITDAKL